MKFKTLLIISTLALVTCCILVLIIALVISTYDKDNNNAVQQIKDSPVEFEDIEIDTVVESIYDENITTQKAERLELNELSLALDALELLQKSNWNGDEDSKLPINSNSFDQRKLKDYIQSEKRKSESLTIPSEFESLFSSVDAEREIYDVIFSARAEYLEYLKTKETLAKYIEEIDHRVLPADVARIKYISKNDPNSPPTAVEGRRDSDGNKVYSELELTLYSVDAYNFFTMIDDSKIVTNIDNKAEYNKIVRNMAVRFLIYHEMTHVTQKAYDNLHVEAKYLKDKSSYIWATKSLKDIDDQYFWEWGGKEIDYAPYNRQISLESQADGIAFEMITNVYDMSVEQKTTLWDYFFGRYDNAKVELNEIKKIFQQNYPEFSPVDFHELLSDSLEDYAGTQDRGILKRTANKLLSLPTYVGYLNPMRPEDTHKFWDALSEE